MANIELIPPHNIYQCVQTDFPSLIPLVSFGTDVIRCKANNIFRFRFV